MPLSALQAIIFDFDGVIANSEPLHLLAFQMALREDGIELNAHDYYGRYLGYDDVGVFRVLGQDRGIAMDASRIDALIARKGERLQSLMRSGSVLFPGAKAFVQRAASAVPIAIASGALRHEIDEIVDAAGIASLFVTIVASGDTPQSKPSPDPYRLAFERLQANVGGALDPSRCVAIEDSRWGLVSARGAGLRCVGVTTSYPAHELGAADLVAGGLAELTIERLDALCARGAVVDR